MSTSLDELDITEDLLKGLYCYGFEWLFPPQTAILQQAEPRKSSTLVQGSAGSGKTTGLIIKVLKKIDFSKRDEQLQGLVLVPNEFLAYQVMRVMTSLADFINEHRISLNWRDNPRILITTPQLAIKKNRINFSNLKILAIDEIDIMLEIGSERRKCIRNIFKQIPKECEIVGTGLRMIPKECYMYDEHLKDSHIITLNQRELENTTSESFVYCPRMEQKLCLLKEPSLQNEIKGMIIFCNTYNRAEQELRYIQDSAFPSLILAPCCGKLHQLYAESLHMIGTYDDWHGIDMQWCNLVVHFDVVCDKAISRMGSGRSGRCGRNGIALYLPSTLEELDFVCELLYGSPNCKYHRRMLNSLSYLDICIKFQNC